MWFIHNKTAQSGESNNVRGCHRQTVTQCGRKCKIKMKGSFSGQRMTYLLNLWSQKIFLKKKKKVRSTCLINNPKELHIAVCEADGFPAACPAASACHLSLQQLWLLEKKIPLLPTWCVHNCSQTFKKLHFGTSKRKWEI